MDRYVYMKPGEILYVLFKGHARVHFHETGRSRGNKKRASTFSSSIWAFHVSHRPNLHLSRYCAACDGIVGYVAV